MSLRPATHIKRMDPLRWALLLAAGWFVLAHATFAFADAGDDQYAVAAGNYSRARWDLASKEFASFVMAIIFFNFTRIFYLLAGSLVGLQSMLTVFG